MRSLKEDLRRDFGSPEQQTRVVALGFQEHLNELIQASDFCFIKPGPATTWDVGTLAKVADWYQGSDGILGITAIGTDRFRLLSAERQPDGLNVGNIELLQPPPLMEVPAEFAGLPNILETVLDDLGRLYENLERRPDDARWVAWRFAEILPIGLEEKQAMLETDDMQSCLDRIEQALHS